MAHYMNYADRAHQIRSDSLADMWNRLNLLQKAGVSAAFAGAVIGLPWLLWTQFLSLDAQLSRWDSGYQDLCYSYDPESELHNDMSYGGGAIGSVENLLYRSRLGAQIADKFITDEKIVCFGLPGNPDDTIEFRRFEGVVIANSQRSDAEITGRLLGIYTARADANISSWSADYTPPDSLVWQRAKAANMYTVYIDSLYRQGGHFDSESWKVVSGSETLAPFADLYRQAFEQDAANGVHNRKNPRMAVFRAAMGSELVTADETDFLAWYRRELNDVARTVSYPCTDANGNASVCTMTVWDPPPRRRNSMELDPETLLAMTEVFFDEDDGYMSIGNAAEIVADPAYREPRTEDGRVKWDDIYERIDYCCDENRNAKYADDGLDSAELKF